MPWNICVRKQPSFAHFIGFWKLCQYLFLEKGSKNEGPSALYKELSIGYTQDFV
jgi:hypothetical protein